MTVKDIQSAKQILTDNIKVLIKDFEEETGTSISEIKISSVEIIHNKGMVGAEKRFKVKSVKVKVEI